MSEEHDDLPRLLRACRWTLETFSAPTLWAAACCPIPFGAWILGWEDGLGYALAILVCAALPLVAVSAMLWLHERNVRRRL